MAHAHCLKHEEICMYIYALPLQLVLGQWDDPHRMKKERNCTHTKKKSKGCVQDGRVSRNILSTSSIQSDVWHHPREVDTGGWREKFGGRRARGVQERKGM